jgi:plasmid maintenance system antidote protein VapI
MSVLSKRLDITPSFWMVINKNYEKWIWVEKVRTGRKSVQFRAR